MDLGEKASNPSKVLLVTRKRVKGMPWAGDKREYYIALKGEGGKQEIRVSRDTYKSLQRRDYVPQAVVEGLRFKTQES